MGRSWRHQFPKAPYTEGTPWGLPSVQGYGTSYCTGTEVIKAKDTAKLEEDKRRKRGEILDMTPERWWEEHWSRNTQTVFNWNFFKSLLVVTSCDAHRQLIVTWSQRKLHKTQCTFQTRMKIFSHLIRFPISSRLILHLIMTKTTIFLWIQIRDEVIVNFYSSDSKALNITSYLNLI